MTKIIIETIPHNKQRYNTVGDWFTNKVNGGVTIHVSQLGSWRLEFLVALHELVEMFQCLHDGITEESVDEFDKKFVERDTEPGDSPNAPYTYQHSLATGIERIMASTLGIQWQWYEDQLEKLIIEREKSGQDVTYPDPIKGSSSKE